MSTFSKPSEPMLPRNCRRSLCMAELGAAAPELPDVADIFADEKARAAPAPRPPPAPDDAYDWIPVEED